MRWCCAVVQEGLEVPVVLRARGNDDEELHIAANSVERSEGVEMLWLGRNISPEMLSAAAESDALVQVAAVEEKKKRWIKKMHMK